MNTSPAGRTMIESFEALRTTAYTDSRGIWTIGYGHTGPTVVPGLTCTPQEADIWLSMDLLTAELTIHRAVRMDLNQHEFDALVSFIYNVGAHAFMNSTCLRQLNNGNFTYTANEMLRWYHVPGSEVGLKKRRAAEAKLFSTGVYP